jgi:tRNA A37 threonylcarbamoyladenosine synthetase subunit TsaC/SUA5/YrdC
MLLFDFEADAKKAFDVVANGGIAIIPMHVGYAIVGATSDAVRRIFRAKQRKPSKLNAITGSPELHRDLHILDARARALVDAITVKYALPLGTVAPARLDHPMLRRIDADILAQSTHEGTIAMLLGGGPFLDTLGRLSYENNLAVLGSSANVSLSGTKFRVADIEPEIIATADVVFDYGLMRWAAYGLSSTMLDMRDYSVVRKGACFDLIADLAQRHFGIRLGETAA